MTKYKLSYVLIIVILLQTGCNRADESYFPLGEGLKWRYAVIKTTKDGIRQQKYIFLSLPEKMIEGQKVSVRKSLEGTLFYYLETEEGVLFFGKETIFDFESVFIKDEHYVLRYPLTVGTEWAGETLTKLLEKTGPPQKTEFKIIAKIPLQIKIVAIDDIVKVPAGTFHNCIRIEKSGSAFKNAGNYIGLTIVTVNETSWYAPGIGLIKLVREESTASHALDKGTMVVELEKFG